MRIKIDLTIHPGISAPPPAWVKKIVKRTLEREGAERRWVSVLLTDNRRIRAINKKHLRHDYATDVISFGADARQPDQHYLGDLVVSVQMARETAAGLGIPFREELARYLIHGTLHLLGYDDVTPRLKARMFKRQEEILKEMSGLTG